MTYEDFVLGRDEWALAGKYLEASIWDTDWDLRQRVGALGTQAIDDSVTA